MFLQEHPDWKLHLPRKKAATEEKCGNLSPHPDRTAPPVHGRRNINTSVVVDVLHCGRSERAAGWFAALLYCCSAACRIFYGMVNVSIMAPKRLMAAVVRKRTERVGLNLGRSLEQENITDGPGCAGRNEDKWVNGMDGVRKTALAGLQVITDVSASSIAAGDESHDT